MKKGMIIQMLNKMGKEKLQELYWEAETLTNMSDQLNISIETLRQYFIKNGIDYEKQLVYNVDHDFFGRDNEKSFCWAGFCAADLNISKDKPRLSLGLATKDKTHLEKFKQDVQTDAPIVDTVHEDNRPAFKSKYYYSSKIRFTSKQMVEDLKRFNIVPAKTYIYTIPDWIEEHPLCHHFLRGLIDGDGWITEGAVGLCGNEMCVKKAMHILSNKCNISLDNFNFEQQKPNVWSFNIVIKPLKKILVDYLFKDAETYLDRKQVWAKYLSENGEYIDTKIHLDFKDIDTTQNLKEIAKELDTSIATVQRRLNDYGIRKIEPRYTYNGCFDQANECEEKYYWLGFLFHHSSFNIKKYKINVSFRMKNVLERLQKFTNYYNSELFDTGKGFRLTMASEEMFNKLCEFGIDKSEIIPDRVINSEYFNHFLRGMLDAKSCCADGRIVVGGREQMRQLLTEKVGLNIQSKNKICLRKHNIMILRDYIYQDATIFIEEKRDKLLSV